METPCPQPLFNTYDLDAEINRRLACAAYDAGRPGGPRRPGPIKTIEPLVLLATGNEPDVGVRKARGGGPASYEFAIPFRGDPILWILRPALNLPCVWGEIFRNTLLLTYEAGSEAEARHCFRREIAIIKETIAIQRERVEEFNSGLSGEEAEKVRLLVKFARDEAPPGWFGPQMITSWDRYRPN